MNFITVEKLKQIDKCCIYQKTNTQNFPRSKVILLNREKKMTSFMKNYNAELKLQLLHYSFKQRTALAAFEETCALKIHRR